MAVTDNRIIELNLKADINQEPIIETDIFETLITEVKFLDPDGYPANYTDKDYKSYLTVSLKRPLKSYYTYVPIMLKMEDGTFTTFTEN